MVGWRFHGQESNPQPLGIPLGTLLPLSTSLGHLRPVLMHLSLTCVVLSFLIVIDGSNLPIDWRRMLQIFS